MRPLLFILLAAPAVATAQTTPRPLIATQILYVTPDSARADFAGRILVDRSGLILFGRDSPPVNGHCATTLFAFAPNGLMVHLGPGGSDPHGSIGGWLGPRDLDSLWVGMDTAVAVLGPKREVARVALAAEPFGPLADSTSWYDYGPLAAYSDGTVLAQLYRREPNWGGIGGELSRALLVRVDWRNHWQRVVAAHPWSTACHARDRWGKEFVIPYCAESRLGVSPSGNYIAEAFVEAGRDGFTVLSLSANGDTNFRKHFVMPTVPMPDYATRSGNHVLDSLLLPEARALVHVPTHRREFDAVIADDDGSIWIDLDVGDGIPHRWIEIDRRGRLVGQVVLPKFTRVKGGLADELWGLVQDPTGPHHGVVRYKITKP